MQRRRRALTNAVWSVAQVAATSGLYVALYAYLHRTVGLEMLGVWSVVMAWASANQVGSLGMGGGTAYFVPKYLARGERAYVAELVQTGILSTAVAIGVGLVALYPLVRLLLGVVIAEAALQPLAWQILPYALGTVWLTSTAVVVYSSLDGFQRIDLRSAVVVLGAGVFMAGAFARVPSAGVVGLAQAQLGQGVVMLVASWLLVRRQMPELPWVPRRWTRRAFREMFGYSVRLQGVTVAQMLFDPAAKSLLAVFGGASAVGLFEMANRLVVQLRAFVVMALTALQPTLTDLSESAPERVRGVYEASSRYMAVVLALATPLLIALAPLVSRLWLGAYDAAFVGMMMLLVVGWFGNLAGSPAYVAYLSQGEPRWVLRAHVLISVLNVGLGGALGWLFGGMGVVLGFVVALLVGSWLVPVAYAREHGPSTGPLWLSGATARLWGAGLAGMAAVLVAVSQGYASVPPVALATAALAGYAAVTAWPTWAHPVRRDLAAGVQRLRARTQPRIEAEA